jgi:hypothetical protein
VKKPFSKVFFLQIKTPKGENFMNRKPFVFSMLLLPILTLTLWSISFATPISIKVGDEIKISGQTPYATVSGGRGGPYTAYSPKGYWDNFLTFCLEVDEYLNFSNAFLVGNISTATDNGGKNTNKGDPLSDFTAYIYTKTVSGAFIDKLDYVQYAIWYEEGEIDSLTQNLQLFYDSEHSNYINSGWSGLGNVRVINLTDLSGNKMQDLIVSVPEPPASATLFFGIGLIGVAGFYGNRTSFKRG